MDVLERNVFFGAVLADLARGFRRQSQQRANRLAGGGPRPQFEHLAE